MSKTPPKPGNWLIKIVLLAAAIAAAYFINVAVQTRLGEDAREATGLVSVPLSEAVAQLAPQSKPILVEFSAVWCPNCRALDQRVFADPKVKAAIETRYIFSRIEYESDEGKAFMERYDVSGFPSIVILNPDGSLLRRVEVSRDPEAILAQL